ncbi:MAG TPA: PAS domain-containing protein [Planctomycetota bacterium]|nr:PAS domain-containing protein [Planctomycetota bacterium]
MAGPAIQPRALLVGAARSRAALAAALEAEGFAVVGASNDAEAYKAIVAGIPEILVADVSKDTLLSREALLVGMLATPARPPFVAVADNDGAKQAAALVERGAFCALREPVEPAEARAVFRRAHQARAKERERTVLAGDLDAMRELVHDVLLNVQDGIFIVDSTGTVQFANDEAARLLAQKRDALVKTRLEGAFGTDIQALLRGAREAADRRASKELDVGSEKERLRVLARGSIIHDHAGKPVGGLVVLRAPDAKRAGTATPVTTTAPPLSASAVLAKLGAAPPSTQPTPTAATPAATPRSNVPRPSPATPAASAPRPPAKSDEARVASILDALRKKTGEFQAKKLAEGEAAKENP